MGIRVSEDSDEERVIIADKTFTNLIILEDIIIAQIFNGGNLVVPRVHNDGEMEIFGISISHT